MLNEKDLLELQKQYAKLIVRVGLNATPGSYVHIHPESLSEPDFITMLVEECYKAGAKYVKVTWNDPGANSVCLKNTDKKELQNIYDFQVEWYKFEAQQYIANIYVESLDPNWLSDVDPNKYLIADAARRKVRKQYREMTRNKAPYVICSVPSKGWAKTLFPDLEEDKAINKLWETIFKCCHVNKEDSIKSWYKHCETIDKHADWLTSLDIEELHYTSKNGTDLHVFIAPNTHFASTGDYDIYHKRNFYSNMPTEECFISPDSSKTEGIVYSTKPLCYDGVIIENFSIRFHKGKAVEVHAEKNEAMLKKIINTDERSGYLGECALVPFDSPINKTGLIFQSILYDENACCHFALGDCYTYTHNNFENMNTNEFKASGFNFSNIHVDFMVGSKDLNIVAKLRNGRTVNIFKDGVFVK